MIICWDWLNILILLRMLNERIEVILILVKITFYVLVWVIVFVLIKIIAWILKEIVLFLIGITTGIGVFNGFGFVILEEIVHDLVSKVFVYIFTAVILDVIIINAILWVFDVFLT